MMPTDNNRAPFFRKPWVRVRNGAGEDIEPFAVLRITATTTDDGEIVYNVAKPNGTIQRNYLVNGPEVLYDTNDGWATTLYQGGYVQCDSSPTPTLGNIWGPGSAGAYVVSDPGFNFEIVGTPVTFTFGTAVPAIQRPVDFFYGDMNGTLSQGSTATARVLWKATGGSWADSGFTATVEDFFHNIGGSVATDVKIRADWYLNRWVVSQFFCAVSDTLP